MKLFGIILTSAAIAFSGVALYLKAALRVRQTAETIAFLKRLITSAELSFLPLREIIMKNPDGFPGTPIKELLLKGASPSKACISVLNESLLSGVSKSALSDFFQSFGGGYIEGEKSIAELTLKILEEERQRAMQQSEKNGKLYISFALGGGAVFFLICI